MRRRGGDRETEIRAVVDELNGLLDEIRGNVGQLSAILAEPPSDGQAPATTEVPAP